MARRGVARGLPPTRLMTAEALAHGVAAHLRADRTRQGLGAVLLEIA